MIQKLKNKIKELEDRKNELRGTFDEYDLLDHLDVYNQLRGIDYAIRFLKDMLIEELLSKDL